MRITKYKGFEIKIIPSRLYRINREGLSVLCDGFAIEIYTDEANKNAVDIIYAAVGYELLENDIHEAEQLAKDYVDCEKIRGFCIRKPVE